MIEQTFKFINGNYARSLINWTKENGGDVLDIKIKYPDGTDPFYGELSVISEIDTHITLGGVRGLLSFTFMAGWRDLLITFSNSFGDVPFYRRKSINLVNGSFDKAIDEIVDEVKEKKELEGSAEHEPF